MPSGSMGGSSSAAAQLPDFHDRLAKLRRQPPGGGGGSSNSTVLQPGVTRLARLAAARHARGGMPTTACRDDERAEAAAARARRVSWLQTTSMEADDAGQAGQGGESEPAEVFLTPRAVREESWIVRRWQLRAQARCWAKWAAACEEAAAPRRRGRALRLELVADAEAGNVEAAGNGDAKLRQVAAAAAVDLATAAAPPHRRSQLPAPASGVQRPCRSNPEDASIAPRTPRQPKAARQHPGAPTSGSGAHAC